MKKQENSATSMTENVADKLIFSKFPIKYSEAEFSIRNLK